MAEVIYSRSPYFVRTNASGGHTGKIEIYIYSGNQSGSWTGSVTYTLTATGVDAGSGNTECIFEIAELIKDKFDLDIESSSNNQSGNYLNVNALASTLCMNVDYQTSVDTGAGFVVQDTVLGYKAVLGYSTYEQGSNYTVAEDLRHFWYDIPYILKPYSAPTTIMVQKQYSSQVISTAIREFDNITESQFFSPNTNSRFFITNKEFGAISGVSANTNASSVMESNEVWANRYPWGSNSTPYRYVDTKRSRQQEYIDGRGAFDYIHFTQDNNTEELLGTKVKIENVYDCGGYTPYRIRFINKYGVLQELWFFKNNALNLRVKSKSYKRNTVSFRSVSGGATDEFYRPQLAQQTIYDKNGQQTITLNSGFYPETFNEAFEQLFLSEYCWLDYKYATLPVVLKDTAFKYRNSKTDGLINHTVTFEFANNHLNNIR